MNQATLLFFAMLAAANRRSTPCKSTRRPNSFRAPCISATTPPRSPSASSMSPPFRGPRAAGQLHRRRRVARRRGRFAPATTHRGTRHGRGADRRRHCFRRHQPRPAARRRHRHGARGLEILVRRLRQFLSWRHHERRHRHVCPRTCCWAFRSAPPGSPSRRRRRADHRTTGSPRQRPHRRIEAGHGP